MFTSCEKSEVEPVVVQEIVYITDTTNTNIPININWLDSLNDTQWQNNENHYKIGFSNWGSTDNYITFGDWDVIGGDWLDTETYVPIYGGYQCMCSINGDTINTNYDNVQYHELGNIVDYGGGEIVQLLNTFDYPKTIIVVDYDTFNLCLFYENKENYFTRI